MEKKTGILLLLLSVAVFTACNNSSSNNSSIATKDSTSAKDTLNSNFRPSTQGAQNGQ